MIVKESISFQRYKDPKVALGLDPYIEIVNKIKDRLKMTVSPKIDEDMMYNSKAKMLIIDLHEYFYRAYKSVVEEISAMKDNSLKDYIDFISYNVDYNIKVYFKKK